MVSGTRSGETGIAPQDRECEVCVSEFSENFPSSAQGRTEYRLRAWGARGFLRAGVRAGQVPGNTGFFAGCLAPLGGGPLTFSTPRAQGLSPCPAGSPCRGLKFWGQLAWMGQGSGPHEGLPARRSRLRTAASRSPTAQQHRPPHHKPTGSLRPGCLHLAPRSALWETESSAGRRPRLPRLKNYISHKSLGRYSRGLSGVLPLRIRCLRSRKRRSLAKRPELTKARREAGRQNYDSQNARGLTASAAFPGPQRHLPEAARTGSASTRAASFPGTSGPGLERPATPSWVPGAGQLGVSHVARSSQPPDCPGPPCGSPPGRGALTYSCRWPMAWLVISAPKRRADPGLPWTGRTYLGPGPRRPAPFPCWRLACWTARALSLAQGCTPRIQRSGHAAA